MTGGSITYCDRGYATLEIMFFWRYINSLGHVSHAWETIEFVRFSV
jgi:hypothetical protein